jgi:hypothetical protein
LSAAAQLLCTIWTFAVLAAFDTRGDELADVLGNRQGVPGGLSRPKQLHRPLRSSFVSASTTQLMLIQSRPNNKPPTARSKAAPRRHVGLVPYAPWFPGIKADTMIQRIIKRAFGRPVSASECRTLLTEVAARLDISATQLDHTIWDYQRNSQ